MYDSETLRIIRVLCIIYIMFYSVDAIYHIPKAKNQKAKNAYAISYISIIVMNMFAIGLTYCR